MAGEEEEEADSDDGVREQKIGMATAEAAEKNLMKMKKEKGQG